jgi:hypothetical protein
MTYIIYWFKDAWPFDDIQGVSKNLKAIQFSIPLCVNYSVYERIFFIIIKIRLLAVEWHVIQYGEKISKYELVR